MSTQSDKTKWVRFKSKPKVRLGLLLVSTRELLDPITNLLSNESEETGQGPEPAASFEGVPACRQLVP